MGRQKRQSILSYYDFFDAAKGAEKELPPQRSRPDGGNAKDETDCYRNYFPSENSHRTGKGPNTPHQREKETKSKETGPQGSASSDDKQAEKRRQGAAARATGETIIFHTHTHTHTKVLQVVVF